MFETERYLKGIYEELKALRLLVQERGQDPANQPLLKTVEQAAVEIGVSTRTIRRWIADGMLQPVRGPKGKTLLIDISDLKALKGS